MTRNQNEEAKSKEIYQTKDDDSWHKSLTSEEIRRAEELAAPFLEHRKVVRFNLTSKDEVLTQQVQKRADEESKSYKLCASQQVVVSNSNKLECDQRPAQIHQPLTPFKNQEETSE